MAKVYRNPRMRNAVGKPAWCLLYKGLDQRWHRKRTDATTREEAEGILRRLMSEQSKAQEKGLLNLEHLKLVVFEQFFRETYLPILKSRVRESTYKRRIELAKHVLPYFGKKPLRAINAGDISRYLARRKKAKRTPSDGQLNLERSLVSAVLNEAFRHGKVDLNEAARVRPFKPIARDLWLRREDVRVILKHSEPWLRELVIFAVHTGLRAGEIVDLEWSNLEHSPGFVRVGQESKTGFVRFVPLNSAAREIIDSRTRTRLKKAAQPFVFASMRGNHPFRRTSVSHAFKRACEDAAKELHKAGRHEAAVRLKAATFHSCRHTFASWAIQGGQNGEGAIPIVLVQHYLGHTDDHMTRRYAHLAPANQIPGAMLEALVSPSHCANVAQDACPNKSDSVSS